MPDISSSSVVGGVDTHADTHTAAVVDHLGRLLGCVQFPADAGGYAALLAWLRQHGHVDRVGVEGTGSYGAGLARFLRTHGVTLVEIDRPNRKMRRRLGKSDPVDAEAAARAALAGTASAVPKARDGQVEAIRTIKVTRASAVKARTAALNALRGMIHTAPEPLRRQLTGLTRAALVAAASALRPGCDLTDPIAGTKTALRRLARRYLTLSKEIKDADLDLRLMLAQIAPQLLEQPGVGTETAAQLLITAGDNPERIRSERSFAMLCGASPIPASSGRTDRHRLNRAGDRQANRALHMIALNRMQRDERTRAYVKRRRAEGLSHLDIMRCLKRYIARAMFPVILASLKTRNTLSPPPTPAT